MKKEITKEIIIDYMSNNKIEFKPTQGKLCLPIINRLCKKMSIGIRFSNIKVADDLIIDGHHRYIASLLAKFNLGNEPSYKTSATAVYQWSSVEFMEDEWDTPEKIQMLNELDAAYNEVSIGVLEEL